MANSRDFPEYQLKIGEHSLLIDEKKFNLLKNIDTMGSITRAAKESHVPYRTALKYIEVMENLLGSPVVITQRGGKGGGGGSELAQTGKLIVKEYTKLNRIIERYSTMNEIEGTVKALDTDNRVMVVQIGSNDIVLPITTSLKKGDDVLILISPEDIFIMLHPQKSSVRNIIESKIVGMEIQDEMVRLKLFLDENIHILVDITKYSWETLDLSLEKKVYAGFKATSLSVIKI